MHLIVLWYKGFLISSFSTRIAKIFHFLKLYIKIYYFYIHLNDDFVKEVKVCEGNIRNLKKKVSFKIKKRYIYIYI